jgi:transcriptional regulator GlxA family with amidase domain
VTHHRRFRQNLKGPHLGVLNSGSSCQRRVALLAYPQLVLLDLVGPCEVFSIANRIALRARPADSAPYILETLSLYPELHLRAASGISLLADRHWSDCDAPIDTLLIPGGFEMSHVTRDASLLRWLLEISPRVRRIGSICSGALVLAAAGVLEGRRATTHWLDCEQLAREYPGISVEPDRIYVKDGNVYTSAGVTAGLDLAIALVEEDLGRELAFEVAQTLVMFVRRPGGLAQFSALLQSQAAERQPLRDLLVWAAEHLDEDLSVEILAGRVHMSVRNFSRAFRRELGKTPARFIEILRVEAAARMLEQNGARIEQVAQECGLGSGDSMRRSFLRVWGVPPSEYRVRFRHA